VEKERERETFFLLLLQKKRPAFSSPAPSKRKTLYPLQTNKKQQLLIEQDVRITDVLKVFGISLY